MQIRHDKDGDAIRIKFNDKKVANRIEVIGEVVMIGVDEHGELVELSVLNASKHISEPDKFEYVDITRLYEHVKLSDSIK